MKVELVRRWGPYAAGRTVDVDDLQGEWLVRHNYAASSGDVVAPQQKAAAEGTHGADPLAGGDATRRRPMVPHSEGSTAHQAPGSPPVYRGGFDGEAALRQGEAARALPEAQDDADDVKKPRQARSKSES